MPSPEEGRGLGFARGSMTMSSDTGPSSRTISWSGDQWKRVPLAMNNVSSTWTSEHLLHSHHFQQQDGSIPCVVVENKNRIIQCTYSTTSPEHRSTNRTFCDNEPQGEIFSRSGHRNRLDRCHGNDLEFGALREEINNNSSCVSSPSPVNGSIHHIDDNCKCDSMDVRRPVRKFGLPGCKFDHRAFMIKVVILLCLSLLTGCTAQPSVPTNGFHFPDNKQGDFVQGLTDFHVSWPSRVDAAGEFLSHNTHARHTNSRMRRDISGPSSFDAQDRVASPDVLHYKIPLHAEQDVIVKVRKSNTLLAPAAVLEKKVSKYNNISDSIFTTLEDYRDCHFSGEILNKSGSLVALSACRGLSGFLDVEGEEYLIEPVKGHPGHSNGAKPHVIYKRSALPEHMDFLARRKRGALSEEPACGVEDNHERILVKRDRWERRRRSVESKSSSSSSTSDHHHRRKRSISTEKHVETLVVVDTDMVNYYADEDIHTYVLTVMNMVATLYQDASIGNAINIVIVRILLMQDPDENLKITHHADKTLKSFCKWQKGINFRDDDHPNHHDVAVLLTRRNICSRMNEPCSTLGLAQVAGLCQPHRTCSVNEDTGLSLAWTVAHEIGHNFGMKHDSSRSGCKAGNNDKVQYVMAPHLTWDKTPSKWSNCSRTSITKFLDRNWGYCLDDPPGHHDFKYPQLPAGTMYDADHQCRLLYGAGAETCHGIEVLENICTTLWCRINNKCSTKLQAAAVGTLCGTDKWCFAGQCVEIGERPQAIDGQWGQWGEWSSCTRTCGAGVSLAERHCNHPPPSNGGKYCTGERKRYRICNIDSCAEDAPSFRHYQCAEFNKIPYKGTLYEWEPLSTPDTPCQLHCKPKNMFFSVMLKDIVTDGTPCVMGSRHMCISGRCRHIGCDWIIDSNAIEDRCGVCFGDGTTCTTIKEQFNETKKLGYVEATVIPAGARNIRVEEIAEASNFLALRNEAGEYYLNGHWYIQWSGDYEVAGTVLHYKRTGNKESLVANGPIKEPLHIMLLMQTHNPGVEFEYTVPKENATEKRKPEFIWDETGWSHCTVSCGGGTQRSAAVCKEKEMGDVDESYCDPTTKPDDKLRSCNSHLCPARWWTGPWQHCSVTCGITGIHRRTVICVRSLGSDEQIALEDSACENLDKPLEVEPCRHKDPCPGLGQWEVTDWSNCTRHCNGGVQFRKVVCVGGDSCYGEKPKSERPCNEQACQAGYTENVPTIPEGTHQSDASRITLPSPSGFNYIKHDPATDINLSNKLGDVNNENVDFGENVLIGKSSDNSATSKDIDSLNQPVNHHMPDLNDIIEGGSDDKNSHLTSSSTASTSTASSGVYEWHNQPWQRCSRVCGKGVRTREVHCIHRRTRARVDDYLCDIGSKPTAITECDNSACLPWQTADWSACSATCGYATQSRQIVCSSPGQCDPAAKPKATRICEDLGPCTAWVYGDWSHCTKTCGEGVQHRLVQCVNLTSQQLATGCAWSTKPDKKQACNNQECPQDANAALSISCEANQMNYKVCRMLKKVGLCHKQYVKAKCCRTCQDHSRIKPKISKLAKR